MRDQEQAKPSRLRLVEVKYYQIFEAVDPESFVQC